jgi:enoyl-CoA hydratase
MRYLTTELTGEEVLTGRTGALGLIALNRPRIINSLSLAMIRQIEAALDSFEADPAIAAVLVTGEGERGFCAGGDIRMLYESGRTGDPEAATFLREEYRLNGRIGRYPKPYVVIIEGITMGGGVGLSGHASHRIATDTTKLAMPETGIGFFPDVGATASVAGAGRTRHLYGIVGEPIGPGDAIAAGCRLLCSASDLTALANASPPCPPAPMQRPYPT